MRKNKMENLFNDDLDSSSYIMNLVMYLIMNLIMNLVINLNVMLFLILSLFIRLYRLMVKTRDYQHMGLS